MATVDVPAHDVDPSDVDPSDVDPSDFDLSDVGPALEFGEVPDADADAVLDPHWVDLRGSSGLPSVYLPPAMASPDARPTWLRAISVVLIAVFLAATAAGVCLTYGPSNPWH